MKRITIKWKLLGFPFIIGFLIFYVFPFGHSIYYSLIESAFQHTFIGLKNYGMVWKNAYYQLALKNTMRFTLISTTILVILTLILSLTFHKGGNLIGKLRIAFVIPMLLPTAAIIPTFKLLFPQNLLQDLMVKNGSEYLLRLPIYFLYLWKNAGYNIILLTTALALIPFEVNEAADMDGAHGFGKVIFITLPMIAPTLFFVVVMSIVQTKSRISPI